MTNKEEIEWLKKDLHKYRIENAELRTKVNNLRLEIFKNEIKYNQLEHDFWDFKVSFTHELSCIKKNWFIKLFTK
jgi:hypothetical protein